VMCETFNPECFLGSRNTAMIAVLLDAGLRASELVDLKLQDCDLEVGYVKVKGKGRKERIVGVSDQTILMVRKYLDFRPDTDCPNLFVTFSGTPLTYNAIQNFFKRLRKRLGFEKLQGDPGTQRPH
jgi:site-specific recombinase XerD